jgi:NAD(P)-dependent dehydrogenase (short-subunit alcohol dehydrogenase family)
LDLSQFARYPSLANKVAFVTGGGSGIGAAIVEGYCRQGTRTAFVDVDEAASTKLSAEVKRAHGVEPLFIPCDIRDVAALQAAIATTAEKLGPIDALVNNAARDDRHKWEDVTVEYWDERMAVNLRPMFFAIQAVAPAMVKRGGGAIVNMGSISWVIKNGGYPVYTAAKAAVQGLTNSAARDFGKGGVRVNTVLPGWVMTERQLQLWVDKAGEEQMDREQLVAGRIQPVDLANMVLFLSADDSRMCTGQQFFVDAGWG